MTTRARLPMTPTEPLPELAEFLAPFRVQFARREGPAALERYCTGLSTEHPNKNCDTLAQLVPGTSERRLQGLLTAMSWDADGRNRQRVGVMAALPTEGDGVLVFDDTGFAKQGTASVGVARQYAGTLGKTGNCQVAVTCHYAERTVAWPVAARLYLPRHWADDADRRARAGVPEGVTFRTKPEVAPGPLDQARAWGVRWSCVAADCDYGDDPNFLAGLAARGQRYVAAVRSDFAVATARRAGESPQRADAPVGSLPAGARRSVRWRQGSRGWLRGRSAAVRCWRVTPGGTRRAGWLTGERGARGQGQRRKFFWSTFGPGVPLEKVVGYAHRRHWVEQFYEAAKGLLGWDQYQGRLWAGFHRHAATVVLAYSFLVWQEFRLRWTRPRPGRPRPASSPSPGPPPGAAPGGPPAAQRLAAGGGCPGVAGARGHRQLVPAHADGTKWNYTSRGQE
jgi:SRSO17 transposase